MIDETQPQAGAPLSTSGSLIRNVNIVMLTYTADGVLALATGALVARALGPDGRGAYGLFVVSAAFGQLLLGLGIGNAAIYYINKGQLGVRDALGAVHVVTFGALAVTLAAVAVVAPLAGDQVFGRGVSPWLLVAAVPLLLYMSLLRLLLQALNRFIDLGITTIGQQAALLTLVAVAFATGDPSPSRIVVFLLIASGIAACYALARIGVGNVDITQVVRPRFKTLRRLIGFGVQGETGNVLQALNYRLDQYVLRGFASLAAVGVYAVAASMTESVFILANAVALVLVPRLTSADADDAAWMAPVAARNTMLIAAGGSVLLAIIAPVMLPTVFGERFEESVSPLWWLLPGTVALTGSKVLTSYIFSQGRPLVNTGISIASLVVTLFADIALIPPFGADGAAAASSLAYVTHLCAALFAYRMISGHPALEALLPRLADAQLYANALRGMRDRLARRAPAGAGG